MTTLISHYKLMSAAQGQLAWMGKVAAIEIAACRVSWEKCCQMNPSKPNSPKSKGKAFRNMNARGQFQVKARG